MIIKHFNELKHINNEFSRENSDKSMQKMDYKYFCCEHMPRGECASTQQEKQTAQITGGKSSSPHTASEVYYVSPVRMSSVKQGKHINMQYSI